MPPQNCNTISFSKGYGLTYSDSDSDSDCTPPPRSRTTLESPLTYDSYWNYQAGRPRKRSRAEDPTEYEPQPPRKLHFTEEMRRQETARYGTIPAAGRRMVRWTEACARDAPNTGWRVLKALCRAGQSFSTILSMPPADEDGDVDEDEDWDEDEDEDVDLDGKTSEVPSNDADSDNNNSAKEPRNSANIEPLPRPVSTILPSYLIPAQVPTTTVNPRRLRTMLNTRSRGRLTRALPAMMQALVPTPPRRNMKSPSERAIEEILGNARFPLSVVQHQTSPDVFDGVILVEYTVRYPPIEDSAEYLCTGGAGPPGTLNFHG